MKKLFNGFVGDGASKQAKRTQRKAKAVGVARSRGGKKNKNRSNGSSGAESNQQQYANIKPLSPLGYGSWGREPGLPDFDPVTVDIPYPSTRNPPTFRNATIPIGTSASSSKHINFTPKTSRFASYSRTQSQLSELTNLLLQTLR